MNACMQNTIKILKSNLKFYWEKGHGKELIFYENIQSIKYFVIINILNKLSLLILVFLSKK